MTKAEKFRRLTCTQEIRDNLRATSVRAATFSAITGAIDFVLRIGSIAVLARLIIPEHFGLVMMVNAVIAVADQFGDLGLSAATAQRKELTHAEVSNLFWVNVVAGLFITVVVCILSPFISNYYREPRLTVITCILASNFLWGGLMVQHEALLWRQLRLGQTSIIRLATSVISTLAAIVLAWMGFGYWALIWREVIRAALLAVGMWYCFPWVPSLPSRKTNIRGLLHYGKDVAGANFLTTIGSGVDRFLIGRFWGPSPVAMYRQGYQLLTTPTDQLLTPLLHVAHPGMSMLQTDDARYCRFYRKLVSLVGMCTMPFAVVVAVYSTEITSVVLGGKWHAAGPILFLLSFGAFIKPVLMTAGYVLTTRGRSQRFLVLTFVHNATLIVFMLVGVHWGPSGVAIADGLTTYLLFGPELYYNFKGSPVTIRQFLSAITRPATASGGVLVALLLLKQGLPRVSVPISLGLGGVVSLLAFGGAMLLMPGGKAELTSLIGDLRSAVQRKIMRIAVVSQT